MADGDGRHRPGRQSSPASSRATSSSTARRSPKSISARSPNGTIRRSRRSIPRRRCPTSRSPSFTAPTARARPSTSPTISRQGFARVGVQDRRGDLGRMAVGIGAKGNDGVANNVAGTHGRDRLRRIRLRQAEQADLRGHDQRGRQGGRADDRSLPGRRRQRRLGHGRPAST